METKEKIGKILTLRIELFREEREDIDETEVLKQIIRAITDALDPEYTNDYNLRFHARFDEEDIDLPKLFEGEEI